MAKHPPNPDDADASAGATGSDQQSDAGPTPEPGTERVSVENYKTQGETKVVVPRGYLYEASDKSIPVIDHKGVMVTAEQAATIIEESGKLVRVAIDKKEGDNS